MCVFLIITAVKHFNVCVLQKAKGSSVMVLLLMLQFLNSKDYLMFELLQKLSSFSQR